MTTAQDQQSHADLSDFEAWYEKQCMRSDDAKQGLIRAWAHLAWKAARALPAGVTPVAWLIERSAFRVSSDHPGAFAVFTAAQVLAMGRVPPGFIAAPVDAAARASNGGKS